MRVICQIVCLNEYIISFHCIIFIWVHLDARNAVRRVLLEIIVRSAVCYENELFCHFCHDWCVHPMRLISTCVLIYAMYSLQRCLPCIFVINVLTSTSMQTRLRNLLILVPVLLLFLCHVNLMLQRDPWLFWDTLVRVFWTYSYCLSIHALGWNYGVV